MATWNPDLLHKYLAPGMATFISCGAPDITANHPQSPHWLVNHFLNSIFRAEYINKYRQYAINLIYRAQVALSDYHEARTLTIDYLAAGTPGEPAMRLYFRGLARWEPCLLSLQIFADVMNKLKTDFKDEPVFRKGDGSPEERAYSLANIVKHWGTEVFASRHDEGDTVPVWLTNAGLQSKSCALSYPELALLITEASKVAQELQDARSFAQAGDA